MPRYRLGLTAGLLALVCGWLCIRPAAAADPMLVISSISARSGHTATLLHNRNILVVGGADAGGTPITDGVLPGVYQVAQILDSSWTVSAAHMSVGRSSHTATLLPNGEVLVVSGWGGAGALASAEVYNPTLNCWHTAIACTARFDHTATLLLDGTVLICGGRNSRDLAVASLGDCDIFTPADAASACGVGDNPGSFSATHPPMLQRRSLHTATKLPDEETDKAINGGHGGRVFFAGGFDPTLGSAFKYLTTAEIYDNGDFKTAYSLNQSRAQHTATLMGNGKVLIVGGIGNYDGAPIIDNPTSDEPFTSDTTGYLQSTEIYDPAGDNTVYGQPIIPDPNGAAVRLKQHTATLLADGSVEILGGLGNFTNSYPDGTGQVRYTLQEGSSVTYDAAALPPYDTRSSNMIPDDAARVLTDYEGLVHNVSGVIDEGTLYFATITSSPTITFKDGNKIEFDPGQPDTRTGLRINLAGNKVICEGTSCGKIVYPAFQADDRAGVVTLTMPPTWTATARIMNGSIAYDPFTSASTRGTVHNVDGPNSPIQIHIDVTGLGDEFKGVSLSNITVTLDASTMDGPKYANNDDSMKFHLNLVSIVNLSGPVTGETGGLTVSLEPTFNVSGTVELSTDTPSTPPAEPAVLTTDTDWTALATAKVTTYRADRLDLEGAELVADASVLIVNKMAFGDLAQYKPNDTAAYWNYPADAHAIIDPRYGHTLTLTSRGASNIIGGLTCDPVFWGKSHCPTMPVPNYTTRVWNNFSWAPTKAFTDTSGTMGTRRAYHTATSLPNGKILVAGGTNGPNVLQNADILDPMTGNFVPTGLMNEPRDLHTATLLPNGRVLVAGGYSTSKVSTGAIMAAEIYYPDTGVWLPTSVMISSRSNHTATALSDGNVLVLGGYAKNTVQRGSEIYYSTAGVWRSVQDMPEGRWLHTATLMRDGRVLVVGGQGSSGLLTTNHIFDPSRGCWEGAAHACNAAGGYAAPLPGGTRVRDHTATLLMDGRVMVAGGNDGNWEVNNVWLYNPVANTWAAGEPFPIKRQNHTATLLPNGTVLVAGGAVATAYGGAPNASVVQYDPGSNKWVTWVSENKGLSSPRAYHTMTMSKDGTLFAIGGFNGSAYLKTAESHTIYSSLLDQFSVDWPPSTRRGHIIGTDLPVISPGEVFTTTGTRFHGMTEASGGGSNGADSDHRHPRLILQSVDGSGGGASQGNSGFIVDLTTQIANQANIHPTNPNDWSATDSSITVQMPASLALDDTVVPYGWYHLRVGANDQLSESFMVQAGPHQPGAQVDGLSAYTPSSTVYESSITFRWYTPEGLTKGTEFDGYNVYVATTGVFISTRPDSGAGGHCWESELGDPCNFITLNGLVQSSTQSIKVSPYNISGDYAGASASTAAYTLPHEPVDVFIASTSANTFFVKWSTLNALGQPYNGKGTIYEAYLYRDKTFVTVFDTFSLTLDNFAPESAMTLTPNIQNYFRVRACNLNGSPHGECSDWGHSRDNPADQFVSTQTMTGVFNVTGSAYSTDTIKWSWTEAEGGVHYNIINATVPFPGRYLAIDVSTNHWTQGGAGAPPLNLPLSQNTRSVIQVRVVTPGWDYGDPEGPLSQAATAYTLATAPIFKEESCPRTQNVDLTTGSIVTTWGTIPGGPGPEGKDNFVTYEIQYGTGPWSRSTGQWKDGVLTKVVSVKYADTNTNHTSTSTVLGGLNQAVPVYVRGRTLNTLGQTVDRAINPDYSYADEWTDLISSYDAVGASPEVGADRFTSTLPMAPTVFYVIPPSGPMSATLWWMDPNNWMESEMRAGNPQSTFKITVTTCTGYESDGTLQPQFNKSTGPDCGYVPSGFDYPDPATDKSEGLWFPTNTALADNLRTWVTYYFTISVKNLPHWEGPLSTDPSGSGPRPNVQREYQTSAFPLPHYYPYIPGVASGGLSVNVTASTGGSVSNGTVGLFDPRTIPPQVQHFVSFGAPGGAFPSDTLITISTFSPTTKAGYRFPNCPGSGGFGGDNPCGGDNNLVFEITADPPLQPKLPLYFTVNYNTTVPQEPAPDGTAMDPKRAVMLRFDPVSCKCVPMRSLSTPDSHSITAELNHLSIVQVGPWAAAATPEFMRIYPNPYYTAREPWLTIDGLPAGCRVRIFTLRGEMALDSNADSNGIFTWQGANRGGRAVASGVYLVVAEGNGIKAIRKLAVIR